MTTKFLLLSCFKHVYIRGLAEDILRDKVFLVSKKDFVTVCEYSHYHTETSVNTH